MPSWQKANSGFPSLCSVKLNVANGVDFWCGNAESLIKGACCASGYGQIIWFIYPQAMAFLPIMTAVVFAPMWSQISNEPELSGEYIGAAEELKRLEAKLKDKRAEHRRSTNPHEEVKLEREVSKVLGEINLQKHLEQRYRKIVHDRTSNGTTKGRAFQRWGRWICFGWLAHLVIWIALWIVVVYSKKFEMWQSNCEDLVAKELSGTLTPMLSSIIFSIIAFVLWGLMLATIVSGRGGTDLLLGSWIKIKKESHLENYHPMTSLRVSNKTETFWHWTITFTMYFVWLDGQIEQVAFLIPDGISLYNAVLSRYDNANNTKAIRIQTGAAWDKAHGLPALPYRKGDSRRLKRQKSDYEHHQRGREEQRRRIGDLRRQEQDWDEKSSSGQGHSARDHLRKGWFGVKKKVRGKEYYRHSYTDTKSDSDGGEQGSTTPEGSSTLINSSKDDRRRDRRQSSGATSLGEESDIQHHWKGDAELQKALRATIASAPEAHQKKLLEKEMLHSDNEVRNPLDDGLTRGRSAGISSGVEAYRNPSLLRRGQSTPGRGHSLAPSANTSRPGSPSRLPTPQTFYQNQRFPADEAFTHTPYLEEEVSAFNWPPGPPIKKTGGDPKRGQRRPRPSGQNGSSLGGGEIAEKGDGTSAPREGEVTRSGNAQGRMNRKVQIVGSGTRGGHHTSERG
ncbi:hypothetical protein T439DRAFT_383520 [Meredithblackwellia eburnea MCA 4105]